MLEFNADNLERVSTIIKKNLTLDLIPRKWMGDTVSNPTYGHCHTVAGCLYKVFGSKNLSMYRGFDGEIYHWWVQDKQGNIIDLTADQYYSKGKTPPYDKGEKAGILGFEYKNRVKKLYHRVVTELENKKEGLFNYYD